MYQAGILSFYQNPTNKAALKISNQGLLLLSSQEDYSGSVWFGIQEIQ